MDLEALLRNFDSMLARSEPDSSQPHSASDAELVARPGRAAIVQSASTMAASSTKQCDVGNIDGNLDGSTLDGGFVVTPAPVADVDKSADYASESYEDDFVDANSETEAEHKEVSPPPSPPPPGATPSALGRSGLRPPAETPAAVTLSVVPAPKRTPPSQTEHMATLSKKKQQKLSAMNAQLELEFRAAREALHIARREPSSDPPERNRLPPPHQRRGGLHASPPPCAIASPGNSRRPALRPRSREERAVLFAANARKRHALYSREGAQLRKRLEALGRAEGRAAGKS